MEENKIFKISMQFFAEPADDGNSEVYTAEPDENPDTSNQNTNQQSKTADQKAMTAEELDRLVQAKADKLNAVSGKKIAELQKELESLKKAHLTEDELKAEELKTKEDELLQREQQLKNEQSKIFALKELKSAGLDDGSDASLSIVEFVMADTDEEIKAKVKTFGTLINKLVSAEVEKKFRENGRNPSSFNNSGKDNKNDTLAKELGKKRAEMNKHSENVLRQYLGG